VNNDYIEFLVKSAKSGRKNAFMELSDFYLKKIYAICFIITADTDISNILTKKIFIKTWEELKFFNGDNLFSEWFYDLAIKEIYDELKTKYIAAYLVEENKKNEIEPITENLTSVEKVILDLEQDERFIFVLHDIENYSLEKIGILTEDNDIEKQGAKLFSIRDKVLQRLDILDDQSQLKLLGRYNEILAVKNSDELSEKLEFLSLSKEKHYELVFFFTTLNSFQPNITPPEVIRDSIFNELFKQGLEEKSKQKKEEDLRLLTKQKFEKELKPIKKEKEKPLRNKPYTQNKQEKKSFQLKLPRLASKQVLVFIVFTCIIVATAYYYTYFQKNTPWQVEAINGRYRISNGTDPAKLFEKQTLITDASAEVLVKIPDVGKIVLKESSELTLNKGMKDLSEVNLLKGTIEITTGAAKSGLVIQCGLSQIIDLGSISKITFKSPGDSRIEVMGGILEVNLENDFVYVIRNYISETRLGARPGVPYNKNASPELVEELKNLQYKNGGFESLTKIINAAKEYDIITLWHLYTRVELTERELIYGKMNEYFAVPSGIEKREIINLDRVKLKQWFDDIQWQL